MSTDKETEQDIRQMQMLEQKMQQYLQQKQQYQSHIIEINSALRELEQGKESYKIIGNIMLKRKNKDLIKELEEKKEIFELRIKTIEKQEEKTTKQSKELQQEVMKKMKKE